VLETGEGSALDTEPHARLDELAILGVDEHEVCRERPRRLGAEHLARRDVPVELFARRAVAEERHLRDGERDAKLVFRVPKLFRARHCFAPFTACLGRRRELFLGRSFVLSHAAPRQNTNLTRNKPSG
jgi:hypothetical protein